MGWALETREEPTGAQCTPRQRAGGREGARSWSRRGAARGGAGEHTQRAAQAQRAQPHQRVGGGGPKAQDGAAAHQQGAQVQRALALGRHPRLVGLHGLAGGWAGEKSGSSDTVGHGFPQAERPRLGKGKHGSQPPRQQADTVQPPNSSRAPNNASHLHHSLKEELLGRRHHGQPLRACGSGGGDGSTGCMRMSAPRRSGAATRQHAAVLPRGPCTPALRCGSCKRLPPNRTGAPSIMRSALASGRNSTTRPLALRWAFIPSNTACGAAAGTGAQAALIAIHDAYTAAPAAAAMASVQRQRCSSHAVAYMAATATQQRRRSSDGGSPARS